MQNKRNSWRFGVDCLIFVIWLSVTRKNTEYKHVWKHTRTSANVHTKPQKSAAKQS